VHLTEVAPLVRVRGLTRRYGDRVALSGVDLDVGPGEAVALLGPNGAGKTTLLGLLAGAATPSAGRADLPPSTGWVPQVPALYGRLTPRENLELFARLQGSADAKATAADMLAALDLAGDADRPATRLSVGRRQRLNVAIGLLGDPLVMLLDEPTASLDPRQRLRLWELLAAVPARGGAVVFATQNVDEASLHATRVAVLVDGHKVFDGTPAEFTERAGGEAAGGDLERAFVKFLDSLADGA
jgi:ABC-2 type transport system ATP-binding protein